MSHEMVSEETAAVWEQYRAATIAKSHFTKQEKVLKAQLCDALGYDPEDPKPQPMKACDRFGEALFEVTVTQRRTLDSSYVKNHYPAVYAEAERTSPSKSIKAVTGE